MTRAAVVALLIAPTARADDPKKKPAKNEPQAQEKMEKGGAVFITPDALKWGEPPPDVPKGAKLAVLYGDPSKPGMFTMRIKAPDGYKIPAHWHSNDEHLTIISGTLQMYMGDTMTGEPHKLTAGSYHFLPAKMHHGAQTKGETIVQVSGPGPFDIHYINPADNPNPKSAKR
ncbi:MAG TPA: cupin domain-containing protein [Kofleriaceae bacterium]|nr:cupin domain-containing protein [Kofleriaceae bacterium]